MPTLRQTTSKASVGRYGQDYGSVAGGASLSMNAGEMSQSQAAVKKYKTYGPGEERPSLTLNKEIFGIEGDAGSNQVQNSSWYDRAKAYGEDAYQGVRSWAAKTLGWSPIVEQDASGSEYTIPTSYYGSGSGEYDGGGNQLSAADVIREIMGSPPEE